MYPTSFNSTAGILRQIRWFRSVEAPDFSKTISNSFAEERVPIAEDSLPSSSIADRGNAEPCLACSALADGREDGVSKVHIDEAAKRGCLTCRIVRDACTELLPHSWIWFLKYIQPGVITSMSSEPINLSTTKGSTSGLQSAIRLQIDQKFIDTNFRLCQSGSFLDTDEGLSI